MVTKIITSVLCLQLLMLSLHAQKDEQKEGYEITGRLKGLDEGEQVIMVRLENEGHAVIRTDSAVVRNGEFHIKGTMPGGPSEYFMQFSHHYNEKFRSLCFYLKNGDKIILSCSTDINTLPKDDFGFGGFNYLVSMEGSPSTEGMLRMIAAYHLYSDIVGRLVYDAKKITDSIGFNGPLLDGIFEALKQVKISIYTQLFSSQEYNSQLPAFMTATTTNQRFGQVLKNPYFTANLYNQLSPEEKNSFIGQKLAKAAKVCVGQPFPEFTLPTPEGQTLALRDVVSKSKLTLVHFYAQNSVARQRYQDELRKVYKMYHDKGLNVIGFYTAKYAEQWKELVQHENYPWYNVSDLKGEEGLAAKVYNEYISEGEKAKPDPGQRIPNTTNVLIDPQGKIVAWDVDGIELQYYLWKYCGQ